MSENDKIINETIKTLGLSAVVPEIYKDLLQPASRELGKNLVTIARTISIALAPLEGATWGYDKIKEWLAIKLTKKLSKVSPQKIQTPPMVIAGPTLFELHFVKDERELKEMYANLLATAMNSDKSHNAHPSFVQVLKQLSPDEAKILNFFYNNPNWDDNFCEDFGGDELIGNSSLSFSYSFHELCKSSGVVVIDNSETYLDNLLRLKIIDTYSTNESQYVPETEWSEPSVTNNVTIHLFTTPFGHQLINTCIK